MHWFSHILHIIILLPWLIESAFQQIQRYSGRCMSYKCPHNAYGFDTPIISFNTLYSTTKRDTLKY